MSGCLAGDSLSSSSCRDAAAATRLKLASLAAILAASLAGVGAPVLFSRDLSGARGRRALLLVKCYAAGVILSTALVHVLPDAQASLSDCHVSSLHPWRDFPFAGLACLLGSLLALLVDLFASSSDSDHTAVGPIKPPPAAAAAAEQSGGGGGGVRKGYVRIGVVKNSCSTVELGGGGNLTMEVESEVEEEEEEMVKKKQRMVSKVLEIGIVFHSVIIGVSMGMSQDVCAIRPLVIALCFHQVFEGMGLGGCIAQAGFGLATVGYMCLMFSVTTPLGIILGMVIFHMTGYDDSSPNALIMEGLLGSFSAGILVYMALVDLISLDFFHNKMMSSYPGLRKVSYIVLVLGSASMSVLALWA